MSTKDKQACKEYYIRTKVRQIMSIQGDSGIAIKTALLSGLRIDELQYVYNQQICGNEFCECDKLHIIRKPTGLSTIIVNWVRKRKKCYLIILPSRLWDNFRAIASLGEGDIKNANAIAKRVANIDFVDFREIYFLAMQSTMELHEIQVLNGKASFDNVLDCMAQLDSLAEKYCKAWEKIGIILPVL
jgi:hypothetical protein